MQTPKRKRRALLERADSFTLLWAGSTFVALIASYVLTLIGERVGASLFANWHMRSASLIIFFVMSLPAVLQAQIVERVFYYPMKKWIRYNVVAATMTLLALWIFNPGTHWTIPNILFNLPIYFIVSTLGQTLWLWGRTRGAWLWPLVSLALSIAPPMIFRPSFSASDQGFFVMMFVLYYVVQARLMHFLLSSPQTPQETDLVADDEDRVYRLQEDEPGVEWIEEPMPLAKRKAR